MRTSKELNVVVIGGMHHNTLGVIRSLGEAGIPKTNIWLLIVESNENISNFISKSKYILRKNISIVTTVKEILPWLFDLAKDDCRRTIICCSDAAAEEVIGNYERLKDNYGLPNTKKDVCLLMKKDVQASIAKKIGIDIPESIVVYRGEKFEWNIFPCITKPLKSSIGAGKEDIRVINCQEELQQALKEIKASKIQIQEYIEKKIEFQLIGCSLDSGNKIIIPGYTEIIRQPKNTNTGYLKYSPIENFNCRLEKIYSFIKEIGYSGLFSVEFIRDKTDRDYLLEINMRNDGNAYCVEVAGINLPYIWVYYLENNQLPFDTKTTFMKPIWFMPDFYDIRVGIQSDGFMQWVREFFTARAHSIYNTKDMGPFVYEVVRRIFRKNNFLL